MDLATALAQCNPHTTSPEQLAIQVAAWAEQAQKDAIKIARHDAEMHLKDTKIAALTFELAYHWKGLVKTDAMILT